MSRHLIRLIYRGEEVDVTVGYSKNMRKYFTEIVRVGPFVPATSKHIVLPSDDMFDDFVMLLGILAKERITLPVEMINEVLDDGERKVGHKAIKWSVEGEVVNRQVIVPEKVAPYKCGACSKDFPDEKMQWCNTIDNLICDGCCIELCANKGCNDPDCCRERIERIKGEK